MILKRNRGGYMMIGDRIKNSRLKIGITLEELGKKTNVNKATIHRYESGVISNIPSDKIEIIAQALNVSPAYLMGWEDEGTTLMVKESLTKYRVKKGVKIPVLGEVAAGIPIEAITDIIDYEEITEEMARKGEYFALKIKGDSMYPRMLNGDVVIVRQQPDIESGDIAVVLVNGDSATVKKVVKSDSGIMLIANNQAVYEPTFYTKKEIEELPVTILGKVVELRGKF